MAYKKDSVGESFAIGWSLETLIMFSFTAKAGWKKKTTLVNEYIWKKNHIKPFPCSLFCQSLVIVYLEEEFMLYMMSHREEID